MLTLEQLRQIVILSESKVSDEVIGKIFNIRPNSKITKLIKKGKKIMPNMSLPIMTMDEDGNATSGGSDSSSGTGGGTPSQGTVKKWESGLNRGPANPIDQNHKAELKVTRGKANPIDSKSKWSGAQSGRANPRLS